MIYVKVVRYKHEIILLKHAEPNQVVEFVRYNRELVITVIVITEFDCSMLAEIRSHDLMTTAFVLEMITLNNFFQQILHFQKRRET